MKSKSNEKVMKKLLVHRSPCYRYYKNMLLRLIYVGLYFMLLISIIFSNHMVFLSKQKRMNGSKKGYWVKYILQIPPKYVNN